MSYQGMRWFKCDLHMHTPEGPSWNDSSLRLPDPRLDRSAANPEQVIQEAARGYLRRCHEVGLEVIAITDHNFSDRSDPREWFLTHLVDQNRTVAEEVEREPLVIFPGFEVDIGYHVVCLFEPVTRSRDLQNTNRVLSGLSLREGRRMEDGNPRALREENAYVPLRRLLKTVQDDEGGIVIAAHAFSTDGICNDAGHADDFRQNERLLCVEVSSYPLRGRAKAILRNPDGCWRRTTRQPAYVMSSDAKTVGSGDATSTNTIGCRHSWIKMSSPSIEALRQAFLDHENRLRLQPESPALDCPHDRVVSVSVQGTRFVADQSVEFSPELNCLIGGRGSGKSSIIEYLRILTREDQGIPEGSEAAKQLERIRGTLTDASLLRLEWESKDGLRDMFEWKPNPPFQAETSIISRSVADPGTVFRNLGVAVYSQKQISELSDDRGSRKLLRLIDGMAGPDLAMLRDEEERVRSEAQQLFLARRKREQFETKRKAVEQEIVELNRQWEARAAMQEPAREHKSAQDAKRHIERVLAVPDEIKEQLDALAEGLPERFPALPSAAANWKHPEFFGRLDSAVQAAVEKMQTALCQAAADIKADVHAATRQDRVWSDLVAYLNSADAVFEAACQEQGLNPNEVEQLREVGLQRRAKQAELDGIDTELTALRRQVAGLPGALQRLASLWRQQSEKRRELLNAVQSGMHRVAGGKHFVEFNLRTQDDETDFLEKWETLAPDRRSKLGREWQAIGRDLHSGARSSDGSPWDHVAAALSEGSSLTLRNGLDDLKPALAEHLRVTRRDDWEEIRLQRVADSLDFTLRRQDGSVAGSLKDGGLSDGQRNTVVLSLLLAKGDGPVIVDQPEDELDSDFIYHELVPVIRQIKRKRQIILATHNANLPVNGDAELVYALKADGGHGVLRAQGGLDRSDVKDAVLDIMEGSDKAFLRRQEKYHF